MATRLPIFTVHQLHREDARGSTNLVINTIVLSSAWVAITSYTAIQPVLASKRNASLEERVRDHSNIMEGRSFALGAS